VARAGGTICPMLTLLLVLVFVIAFCTLIGRRIKKTSSKDEEK